MHAVCLCGALLVAKLHFGPRPPSFGSTSPATIRDGGGGCSAVSRSRPGAVTQRVDGRARAADLEEGALEVAVLIRDEDT